jgi:4-aminobutyrate aminotransferase
MENLKQGLAPFACVEEVRGLGLMIGIEFNSSARADLVARECFSRGLLVLGCGDKAIRLSPPLIITEAQAETAANIITSVIADSA